MRISTTAFLVVVGFVIGLVGVNNASAAINTKTAPAVKANDAGQCNGPDRKAISGPQGYFKNLQTENVVDQAAKAAQKAGYKPTDGTFVNWLNARTMVASLAAPATVKNTSCRSGILQWLDKLKVLAKGDKVLFVIPAQYASGDLRASDPGVGWKPIVLSVQFVAQASCSNPGSGTVLVRVWVRIPPPAAAKPTSTKAGPATINAVCSVVVTGDGNKITASQCNQYWLTMICSSGPVTIAGPDINQVAATANKYRAKNCPTAIVPPAKPVPGQVVPLPPKYGSIVKSTPGWAARTSFRFNVLCGTSRSQKRAFNDTVPVQYLIPDGVKEDCVVTELQSKGWKLVSTTHRGLRWDFVNQQAAVATAAGFIATVSKRIMNSAMTADFTSFYRQYRLPVAVYVNGQKAFDIVVPMNGDTHAVSKDGKTPFVFVKGDAVKLCEDLGFARGLVLEPVAPVGADGCLAAIKGIAGVVSFAFIDRAVESARQPTTVVPVTPATPTSAAPPANRPPVLVINTQHMEYTTYTREVCGTVRDQEDQASLTVWFTAGRGDVIPLSTYMSDAVTWCFTYRAPMSPGTDHITVHALDGHNPEQAVPSNVFEIRAAP